MVLMTMNLFMFKIWCLFFFGKVYTIFKDFLLKENLWQTLKFSTTTGLYDDIPPDNLYCYRTLNFTLRRFTWSLSVLSLDLSSSNLCCSFSFSPISSEIVFSYSAKTWEMKLMSLVDMKCYEDNVWLKKQNFGAKQNFGHLNFRRASYYQYQHL